MVVGVWEAAVEPPPPHPLLWPPYPPLPLHPLAVPLPVGFPLPEMVTTLYPLPELLSVLLLGVVVVVGKRRMRMCPPPDTRGIPPTPPLPPLPHLAQCPMPPLLLLLPLHWYLPHPLPKPGLLPLPLHPHQALLQLPLLLHLPLSPLPHHLGSLLHPPSLARQMQRAQQPQQQCPLAHPLPESLPCHKYPWCLPPHPHLVLHLGHLPLRQQQQQQQGASLLPLLLLALG